MGRKLTIAIIALSVVGLIYMAGCDDDDEDFITDPDDNGHQIVMPLAAGLEWHGTIYYIDSNLDTTDMATSIINIDTIEVVANDTVHHLDIDVTLDSSVLPEYLYNSDSGLVGYIEEGVDLMLGPYTVAEYPVVQGEVFESYLGFRTQAVSTRHPVEVPAGGFITVYYRSIHPGFSSGQSDISQIDRYFDPTHGLVRADVWGRDQSLSNRLLYIWSLDTLIVDTGLVK